MEYVIGLVLALMISLGATVIGFDRERSFYPTTLMVIGLLYELFPAMGGSTRAAFLEAAPSALFVAAAAVGFRKNLWLVAAGLFLHGVFDFAHPHLISNPGVPLWWPGFCFAYDVTAAAYLGWLIKKSERMAAVS